MHGATDSNILVFDKEGASTLGERVGHDLIGPVLHRWLLGLHQHIAYLDDKDVAFLFCARAGVRIKELYDLFLASSPFVLAGSLNIFWASRVSVTKGTFQQNRHNSSSIIQREYHNVALREIVKGLLRHHPQKLEPLNLSGHDLDAHGFNFNGWINVNAPLQNTLRKYLEECSDAFDSYLAGLTAGKKRIVLVDSGWQGSIQALLSKAYSNFDWKGLYFGRILAGGHDPRIADNVVGVLFEQDTFNARIPESAIIEHRHLIETLLEPNGSSIEEVPAGQFREIAQSQIDTNLKEVKDPDKDRLFLAARHYLQENIAKLSISEIFARHQIAVEQLARLILTPTKREARALFCKSRSADFGRTFSVPVLLEPDAHPNKSSQERISRALWKQGQIALEYEDGPARELQLRLIGKSNDANYFDPRIKNDDTASAKTPTAFAKHTHPTVAVITRTKNRPLLLERAARSVAAQTFTDYIWIVVNDGGDQESVRRVVDNCLVDRRRIFIINNEHSLGMEAASNLGIRNSNSDYVVIHDDDDSWAPEFLKKTTQFLGGPSGQRYGGVITHSIYVSEEIQGNSVIEHSQVPYQDWVRTVQLVEMACANFYPPIAFLFRRNLWKEIGGYDEELPVLGDWMFNLEFLLRSDIGVIIEPLAYYHHRDRGDPSYRGAYSNSVIGGVSKHEEFTAVVQNKFLRKNLGRFPAALAILHGYGIREIRALKSATELPRQQKSAPAPSLLTVIDIEPDRMWVAHQIREHFNRQSAVGRWRSRHRRRVIDYDASLSELLILVEKSNIKILPPLNFDEDGYLVANRDVAIDVRSGKIASGYFHFLRFGYAEGRDRPRKHHA